MKSFKSSLLLATVAALGGLSMMGCDGRRQSEASFRVETVSLEKSKDFKVDDYGLAQTKEFTFKACLTDSNSHSSINIAEFTVGDGKSERKVISDSSGCVQWKEIHSFSSFQQDRMLKIVRSFRSLDTYTGTVTVELAFNPWDDTLVDLRKDAAPDLEAQADVIGFDTDLRVNSAAIGRGFAEALLSDVQMDFFGHDVSSTVITPLLTMKPAQRFRVSIKPQFLLRRLKNDLTTLNPTKGQFRLRLVVLRDNGSVNPGQASDIVAYAEDDVNVQFDGWARKDMLVRIHDVSAIMSRNHFLLIVEPKGEVASVTKPGIYKGFIAPLRGNNISVNVIPVETDGLGMMSALSTAVARLNQVVRPLDLLANSSGMKEEVGVTTLKDMVKTNPEARQLVNTLRAYCDQVYDANATSTVMETTIFGNPKPRTVRLQQACRAQPERYLRLEKREFVESVLGQPRHRADLISNKSIQISRDLKYMKVQASGEKRDYGHEYGFSGSAGFNLLGAVLGILGAALPTGLDLGFNLKAGIGTTWAKSQGLANQREAEMGISISENNAFSVASVGYDLDVEVRSCVLLGAAYGPAKGLYGCADETRRRSTTETYYQINHSIGNSVFADEDSASSTLWRVTIRGQDSYQSFENLMTKGNGVLKFEDLGINNLNSPLLPDFKVTQSFPGVISSK